MQNPLFRKKEFYILLGVAFFICAYIAVAAPPWRYPSKTIVSVREGIGLRELSEDLKMERVIRSPLWFRISAILLGGERRMKAGDYYLSYPENNFKIAWRVVRGDHKLATVKLTIPEGFNVRKISALFDERFPLFDNVFFESIAPEGYLFPDTYFVAVNATASSTIKLMRDNFIRKVFPITPDIEKSGRTLEEIIIMASLIENEAKTSEDREIISGILWKRLKLGLPLQVDAAFSYINGKTTRDLTQDDLKIKSPYNTYLYPGLPPTPISNPGLESINAAIHPTTTPYLYFLTADDGTMHYSRTFDEHVEKKRKYIVAP